MPKSKFEIEIDSVTASEWNGVIDGFQDANVYQTWCYGSVRWGEANLSHLVLRRDSTVVAATQLRIVRAGPLPGGIAHVRWGPLVHRTDSDLQAEVLNEMASALHDEYVRKRRLYLRILPNAFADSPTGELFERAFSNPFKIRSRVTSVERTFVIDLRPPLDQIRKQLDQKWRNQLNRAERNDLTVRAGTGMVEYELFAIIYAEMRRRKRFETSVNVDEFARLCDQLENNSPLRILLCCAGREVVSGIICSAMGNTGVYLLGATSPAGLQVKGAYLLQWSMIRWLKENGFEYYDLGGINPAENPGVYHFKKGLSGTDVTRLEPIEASGHFMSNVYMRIAGVF